MHSTSTLPTAVNVQTPVQPLLFAPDELRACGLRDAHTHPLVGTRTADGVRSWRTSPARAWAWPLVEWNRTGNSYAAIGFDCDSRESIERAAASCMGGDLPTPNVHATRTASGHSQVFYLLARPVHRGEHARPKPLRQLARVAEYYRAALGADVGYRGVLSSNPTHADYQASYPRFEPYALGDLASVIPKGWRVPRPATTAEGRNCQLFWGLCRLALRCSDEGLLTLARTMNGEYHVPLSDSEVMETWRSVCRYRVQWRRDGHAPWWLARQSRLATLGGNASGVARRAGTVLEHDREPWADLGVSRATWYRDLARTEPKAAHGGARPARQVSSETEPYTGSTPFRLF